MSIPIGNQVRALRSLHNISQQQLSERSGLNRNIIIDIENNRRILSDEERAALERAFSVSLADCQGHFEALAGTAANGN